MLDYTSKSSTFSYNCLSYIFMLISLYVEKKMWEHVKKERFHVYVMRSTQNKLIVIEARKVYYYRLYSI